MTRAALHSLSDDVDRPQGSGGTPGREKADHLVKALLHFEEAQIREVKIDKLRAARAASVSG